MTHPSTLDVGLAVHKDPLAVASVAKDHDADVISLGTVGTRHGDLDQRIRKLQAKAPHLSPVVEALQALRGVPLIVAVTTVAALGDLTRFDHPRALLQFLGLIPSEYSAGERRQPGSLTTAGNTHARRAPVEGAWAAR
jgi:transposase